ncbi:MAG TPA: PepSY-associated TM helix domain-containing protein [Caulobacteraceae bacterium]|nr:PepSY-associated TM helix domain-containing protein [Caulobacteraceae bacterium]
MPLRAIHRIATLIVVLFTLYLGVTGTLIQLVDLRSIFTHASPFDANVRAMREAFNGPGDYEVITAADYLAPALPRSADLTAMVQRVATGARAAVGPAPFDYVELRMAGGRPVGQVKAAGAVTRLDAITGANLGPTPVVHEDDHPASDRNTVKELHRMTTFGARALWINIGVSIGLATLIVTGSIIYGKMLLGRLRLGRKGLFWWAGGWWRTLHRAISVLAAAFLTVVCLSGAWLAVESLGLELNMEAMRSLPPSARPKPAPPVALKDAALPGMMQTTLAAYAKTVPGGGVRVVRLRYYGSMPQGVIVSDEPTARQLVYDASTGRRVSETEPGYPRVGFPFGWQAHQTAKSIHRGDAFGLTGRFMDLLSGLALIYLSVSGVVMYLDMWKRRRALGRKGLVWI